MTATYTLPKETLSLFIWGDMLEKGENTFARPCTDYRVLQEDGQWSKEMKIDLYRDNKGVYFFRRGIKIYVKDFDYFTYKELVEKVRIAQDKKDRWYISHDAILASFLKEPEKVRVMADLRRFTAVTPFGFGLVGSETKSVVCKLTEERYKKEDWHYKITLAPVDDSLRAVTPPENYYFDDFADMLLQGRFNLILEGE